MKNLFIAFIISVAIVTVNCGSPPRELRWKFPWNHWAYHYCIADNVCGGKPDAGFECPGGVPKLTYFFNPNTGLCEPLQYNGCGGNGNRFDTKYLCELTCSKVCEFPMGKPNNGFGCRRPTPGPRGKPSPPVGK